MAEQIIGADSPELKEIILTMLATTDWDLFCLRCGKSLSGVVADDGTLSFLCQSCGWRGHIFLGLGHPQRQPQAASVP
jgi:hypothetical protein